ncbi:MAG: penicillin-binding transpeptidase domain-containing protein [Alistipes sp.]|nr:penicillin-binding transpeptidase domain-containing protein [Alistipes sp.]
MNTIKGALSAAAAAISLLTAASCATIVENTSSGYPPIVNNDDSAGSNTEAVATDAAETPVTTAAETTAAPETTTTTPVPDVMRGNLYDADGDLLMFSSIDENGDEVRMTNDYNKVAFANILNEMSEGLDLTLDKQLRTPNATPVEGGDFGQSVQLTFDADTQIRIYDYMAQQGMNGCAVVMRSDGSLMAQVNYPSYDPDIYYGTNTEEDLAWGPCGNKAFQNFPPGSCFKIMSEVISDKHGIYSLYDEGTWEYEGTSIVNWDHKNTWNYPQQRSLNSAFVNSSNIFFAKAFDQIGADDVLADLDNIFHFVSDIECDFGVIENNVEIYCNDDLRRTAFGQSYVLTCPIYLAALGREAAYGDMVRPFTVKNYVDTNNFGSVISAGSQAHDVIGTIPQEYRQNLLDGMSGVGSGLGVYVPSGYSFYAKTGTAETWDGDYLYITGIVKNASDDGNGTYTDYNDYNGSYIIVMQLRNPENFGFSFASDSAALYQGLVNCVVG